LCVCCMISRVSVLGPAKAVAGPGLRF
jgi:hypothetical protein